jgi:hypothetical protein
MVMRAEDRREKGDREVGSLPAPNSTGLRTNRSSRGWLAAPSLDFFSFSERLIDTAPPTSEKKTAQSLNEKKTIS